MKRFSTIVAPGIILLAAVLTGGWFFQRGVTQEQGAFRQVRLMDEVLAHVQTSFVDPVDREELYEAAIEGILENLGDPNTSYMPYQPNDQFRMFGV